MRAPDSRHGRRQFFVPANENDHIRPNAADMKYRVAHFPETTWLDHFVKSAQKTSTRNQVCAYKILLLLLLLVAHLFPRINTTRTI